MPDIRLIDFFVHYKGTAEQKEAVQLLQSAMPETLKRDKSAWVVKYREKPPAAPPTEGKTSAKGRQLISDFEGCRLDAYICPAGVVTIGVGHTGPDVHMGQHISQAEADSLLAKDLQRFEEAVDRIINVPFNQDEFDATVSFAFNTGEGALAGSTFTRRINAGEDKPTCFKQEFPKWVNGSNGPLPGLVRRRDAEVKLAVNGQYP